MTGNQNRKLQAILFADIAGYTALMRRNETHARKILQKFQSTINEQVTKVDGKVIHFFGDGCLCTFDSAVSAVKCAVAAQNIFQIHPEVPVRIGLHSGDVVFENDNVYGDSVNIASRIESMGVPESVLLSKRIKRHIANHPEFEVISVGEFLFKNVDKRMEVFALANHGLTVPKRSEIKGKIEKQKAPHRKKWPLVLGIAALLLAVVGVFLHFWGKRPPVSANPASIRSIAVLAFENVNGKEEDSYFCEGVAEDILDKISKVKDLRVISAQTMRRYQGSNASPLSIADELGATYVLHGSIQMNGEQVKVVSRLSDTRTKGPIWSGTFNNLVTNIFDIQSEIASSIAQELKSKLSKKEKKLIAYQPTENIEAYRRLLQAKKIIGSLNYVNPKEVFGLTHHHLTNAIELDPKLAEAHALKGWIFLNRIIADPAGMFNVDSARYHLDKAIRLNPDLPIAYRYRATLNGILGNQEARKADLLKTESLNPNDVFTLLEIAEDYEEYKQFVKSWEHNYLAHQLEPFNPRPMAALSRNYRQVGDAEKAIFYINKALAIEPSNLSFLNGKGIHEFRLFGNPYPRIEGAKALLEEDPNALWGHFLLGEYYAYAAEFELSEQSFLTLLDLLKQGSLPENTTTPPYRHRYAYTLKKLGKTKAAERQLREAIDFNLKVATSPYYNPASTGEIYDLAGSYAQAGKPDSCMYWLQKSTFAPFHFVLRDPMFDPVREEPAFKAYINERQARVDRMRAEVRKMEIKG